MTVPHCERHDSVNLNEKERPILSGILERLPITQADPARHRCPFCAYEQGLRDARLSEEEILDRMNR